MSNKIRRLVIVGATSAIAEHCARLWLAEAAASVTLIGRNNTRLQQIQADLQIRSPQSTIDVRTADFLDPASIRALADELTQTSAVDLVLIAHGTLPDQAACQNDLAANGEAIAVNGMSPVLFAEAFAGHMQRVNSGTLIIIGSVAGDRGRKSNYVYGAAKGLVTRYAQGLQHRMAPTAVRIILVKPGPTDTPMTATLKQQGGALAKVEDVAAAIVKGAAKGQPVIYAPVKWAVIMMVIRHLPRFVFNKMNI